MKQAVILAGGKGTRLSSVLGGLPKALAVIGERPLLGHQLHLLHTHGFDEAVLLVNSGAAHIAAWLQAEEPPLPVRLIDDGTPRGTAGAVLAALDSLAPDFLVIYGDTMLNVDLSRFLAWHRAEFSAASLFLHPNDHPADSDLVETDGERRVLRFHPYPHPPGAWLPNLVNAALYVVRREALRPWANTTGVPLDFGKDLFPRMLDEGLLLGGYNSPEYIKDAGTPARLERVREAWASGAIARASLQTPQRAVLIDRDGTLNRDNGHIARAEDLHVYDFAGPALRRLNECEWRSILISNQPVLARGEATNAEMRRIQARLDTELARDHAFLDRQYICPHHPDSGYPGEVAALKIVCDCRKPGPGLIARAAAELNLDLATSWFIGDSTADLGAAEQAGVSAILVETGNGGLDGRYPYEAGFTVRDFAAAVDLILDLYPALAKSLAPLTTQMQPGQDWFVGGLARSGKSTVAATLARQLRLSGTIARVIHLDRWLLSLADRPPGVFNRFDTERLVAVHARAATRAQTDVQLSLPAYHRRRRQRQENALGLTLHPGDVVIWEGVVALELARRLGLSAQTIQIDTDETGRRTRFLHYDTRRGLAPEASASSLAVREDDEHPAITALADGARFRITIDDIFAKTKYGADA